MSDDQIFYNGRWVPKDHFRAFVYNSTGQKLCNSYQEFSDCVSSGIWFASPLTQQDLKTEKQVTNVVNIKYKRGRKCQNPHKM